MQSDDLVEGGGHDIDPHLASTDDNEDQSTGVLVLEFAGDGTDCRSHQRLDSR